MNEEYYLTYIKDRNIRRNLTKLRISAHNLEIERGRHNRNKNLKKKTNQNTPATDRRCQACTTEVEDEFHLMMKCGRFDSARQTMIERLSNVLPDFRDLSENDMFILLMKSAHDNTIDPLVSYLKTVTKVRGNF